MFAVATRGRSAAQGGAQRRSRSVSLPPPIRGMNAVDSIADMKPDEALLLRNAFPRSNSIEIRWGYSEHATGLSGQVESLIPWEGPASAKMFAADDNNIYEVTSAGAVGTAAVSSLSNGRWQHAMQATSGGNFTVIANGADSVRHYNGTTWATPTINNVTSSGLDNLAVHKRRIWFVEKDTTSAWYLAVDAIAGDATEFNFGPLFSEGGKLLAIGSMTMDSGVGPDDFAAFFSTKGEVAVYAGTDPSSATTWAIVGVFRIPPPIGKRCVRKVGGDLIVITRGGLVSLRALMSLDISVTRKGAITDKVNPKFISDSDSYASHFGWEVITYPRKEQLIVNVPTVEGVTQIQRVMNTITGAWCEFDALDANCWGIIGDDLYFGGNDGNVLKADTGFQDDGDPITAEMICAFSYLGAPARLKSANMIRPLLESEGQPEYLMALNVDFGTEAPLGTLTSAAETAGAAWDEENWDVAEWAGGSQIVGEWQGASGLGYAFAARMQISTNGARASVHGFTLMIEDGGLI